MRLIRLSAVWAAIALGVGLFVLVGYFVESDFVQGYRLLFMQWAVLLAAAALLVGLVNLAAVHWRKVSLTEQGWIYSAVLILAFLVTLIISVFFGPDNEFALFIFRYLQLPLEASLMALLAVTLLVAGFRLLSRRKDLFSLVFLGIALVILLGTGPLPGGEGPIRDVLMERLGNFRNWISQVVAVGAARGILLGVALGATTTGLRVLLAADRPYGT
jgi:hypothetical protein